MHYVWNYHLVTLSIVIAIVASYIALDIAGRLRRSAARRHLLLWYVSGAFMMGLGIWSMHFVGMTAMVMDMPIVYEPTLMTLSILAAMIGSGIAFFMVSHRTIGFFQLLLGGTIMGVSIASMHYIGMASMQMHAEIHYDIFYFYLSVMIMIAITASTLALWLAFRLQANKPFIWVLQKIGSAIVMGGAISGMHYMGMYAARFTTGTHSVMSTGTDAMVGMFKLSTLLIFAGGFVVLGLLFLSAQIDAERQRVMRELQRALKEKEYNEEKFRRIAESNMISIAFWQREGQVTDANLAFLDMLGYRQADLALGRIADTAGVC